jgi:hypothetical protein
MDINTMTLELNEQNFVTPVADQHERYTYYKTAGAQNSTNHLLELYLEAPEPSIVEKIIQIFKWDSYYSIEDKILITNYILYYSQPISTHSDFYEEECHLVLVNWIYNLKNEIQRGYTLDPRIYHLLYNILNIFESFPIDFKDLFNLNIYEKLNKIRKIMKKINYIIYCKLDCLLNYWKTFSNDNMLNKKRLREFEQEYIDNLLEVERYRLTVKVSIDFDYFYKKFILKILLTF